MKLDDFLKLNPSDFAQEMEKSDRFTETYIAKIRKMREELNDEIEFIIEAMYEKEE